MSEVNKVFLGGTCNNSDWRDKLIPQLHIDYFNPVVEDWTEECYQEELTQREKCSSCLYVITADMKGTYSIAEVVDDSNKRPEKTIFAYLPEGFNKSQIMSLERVGQMVYDNGGIWIKGMLDTDCLDHITTETHIATIANWLNETI